MSGEIGVGDLVVITRAAPCCGECGPVGRGGIGYVFVVTAVFMMRESECDYCEAQEDAWLASDDDDRFGGYDIRCLTKIDPPAVPQEVLEEVSA